MKVKNLKYLLLIGTLLLAVQSKAQLRGFKKVEDKKEEVSEDTTKVDDQSQNELVEETPIEETEELAKAEETEETALDYVQTAFLEINFIPELSAEGKAVKAKLEEYVQKKSHREKYANVIQYSNDVKGYFSSASLKVMNESEPGDKNNTKFTNLSLNLINLYKKKEMRISYPDFSGDLELRESEDGVYWVAKYVKILNNGMSNRVVRVEARINRETQKIVQLTEVIISE